MQEKQSPQLFEAKIRLSTSLESGKMNAEDPRSTLSRVSLVQIFRSQISMKCDGRLNSSLSQSRADSYKVATIFRMEDYCLHSSRCSFLIEERNHNLESRLILRHFNRTSL